MSLYPDLPGPRGRALIRDGLTLVALAAFAWLGLRVHHDVGRLAGLGSGVESAGGAVRQGFAVAAGAAQAIPLAGGAIAHALLDAAGATGGNIQQLGREGAASARHLATVLGLLIWLIPSLLLVVAVLPARLRQVRELRALRLALSAPNAAERRRLLALRAAVGLPEQVLFAYTPDPAGDLLAGRHEALAAAALEQGGLRAPAG